MSATAYPGSGKQSPMSGDLASIDLGNGVNAEGRGFITVTARTSSGRLIVGQLDPDEARTMALHWLEVAEAAEQDAATLRCVRKLELPDQLAGAIIAELRDGRTP